MELFTLVIIGVLSLIREKDVQWNQLCRPTTNTGMISLWSFTIPSIWFDYLPTPMFTRFWNRNSLFTFEIVFMLILTIPLFETNLFLYLLNSFLIIKCLFFRMVPNHERIVNLIGSVIDYSYGGGQSPAVLLVMERYPIGFIAIYWWWLVVEESVFFF